jgi:hypothetical protein
MPGKRTGGPRGKPRVRAKKPRARKLANPVARKPAKRAPKRRVASGWETVNRQAKQEKKEQVRVRSFSKTYNFKNSKGVFRKPPKTPSIRRKSTSKRILAELARDRVPVPDITAVRREQVSRRDKKTFKYRYSWFFHGLAAQGEAEEMLSLLIRKTDQHPSLQTQAIAYIGVDGQSEPVVLPSKQGYPQQTLEWLRNFFNNKYTQAHVEEEHNAYLKAKEKGNIIRDKKAEKRRANREQITFEVRAWSNTKVWP